MPSLRFLGLAFATLCGTGALYTGNSGNNTSRAFYGSYGADSFLVARGPGGNSSAVLRARDVWSPAITSPDAQTVWVAGTTATVTWDTSNPPADVTNPRGRILLGHVEDGTDEHLDVAHPLADGFDIRAGKVQVKVPYVSPGNDYIIVLMGDSGNKSPSFVIN